MAPGLLVAYGAESRRRLMRGELTQVSVGASGAVGHIQCVRRQRASAPPLRLQRGHPTGGPVACRLPDDLRLLPPAGRHRGGTSLTGKGVGAAEPHAQERIALRPGIGQACLLSLSAHAGGGNWHLGLDGRHDQPAWQAPRLPWRINCCRLVWCLCHRQPRPSAYRSGQRTDDGLRLNRRQPVQFAQYFGRRHGE